MAKYEVIKLKRITVIRLKFIFVPAVCSFINDLLFFVNHFPAEDGFLNHHFSIFD